MSYIPFGHLNSVLREVYIYSNYDDQSLVMGLMTSCKFTARKVLSHTSLAI